MGPAGRAKDSREARLARATRQLPLLFVASAMLVPLFFGLLLVGTRVACSRGPLALWLEGQQNAPLGGVEIRAPTPSWSMPKLLVGDRQAEGQARWSSGFPLRTPIVRSTNEFYFRALDRSYMYRNRVLRARGQYLFERTCVERYCNWNRRTFSAAKFAAWAGRIRALRDLYASRGQRMVCLISPSKAAFAPEYLPPGISCAPPARPGYTLAPEALQRAGVRFLDGSALLAKARAQFPSGLLFSPGDTHWTGLVAALTTRELLRLAATPERPLQELRFDSTIATQAAAGERDLIDLPNFWNPDTHYPMPRVHILPAGRAAVAPRIAMVGSSFSTTLLFLPAQAGLFEQIDLYYYFSLRDYRQRAGGVLAVRPNEQRAPGADPLRTADIVVVEENESGLNREHPRLLLAHEGLAAR